MRKSTSTPINNESVHSLLSSIEFEKEHYSKRIYITGPESPLEIKEISQLNYLSKFYNIKARINTDSINYVLLDDDPQIQTDRLLIACDIACDITRDTKKSHLKNTCLLPKIKGLLPLTCMIFAPFMELRFYKILYFKI